MKRPVRLAAVISTILALASCTSTPEGDGARLERITLAPHEARRSIGHGQHFTATGHYTGGTTRNLTQRVEYAASDPTIARAANAKGDRSRIDALAAGTITISATDRTTGVSSHTSGDDATFTVLGALERITLAPAAITRWVGQSQRLTATGHYIGGVTRNLTQHVVYRSSDVAIVVVPNADGDKSRIDAVGVGTATISAVDPASGVTSGTGGGAATVTVTVTVTASGPTR